MLEYAGFQEKDFILLQIFKTFGKFSLFRSFLTEWVSRYGKIRTF